jgi:hypothetical protein
MNKLIPAFLALALFSSMAWAGGIPVLNVTVTPWDALNGVVLCPDLPSPIPASVGTVTVHDEANNPVANQPVTITFLSGGPFCFCSDMSYTAMTNYDGVAVLTLRGGGCVRNTDFAAIITCGGVLIRDYQNAKSPDWDGVRGNCTVNLSDLVAFSRVPSDLCFDFNNDGRVDTSDLVIFTSGFTPAHHCQ